MNIHRVQTTILTLLTAMAFHLPSFTQAQSYEVTGEITYTPFPETKSPQHSTYEFRLVVDGDKWLIRNTPKPVKGILYQEAAYDGKEVREVTQFDPDGDKNSLNSAIGLIEYQIVPPAEPPMHVGEVWLALASSAYLRSRTNNLLTPIWEGQPHVREFGYGVQADWKLSDAAPELPLEVRYFSDGKNYSAKEGKLRGTPTWAPYDAGYLFAEYKAEGSTNVSGLTFPIQFTFARFAPKRDGATKEELTINSRVTGKIHSIVVGVKETVFSPALISKTWIVDRRFVSKRITTTKMVDYIVEDKIWPTTNAPIAQAAFDKAY